MNTPIGAFEKKRILVTGASGFIASGIINALSGTECTITRLSRQAERLLPVTGDSKTVDVACDITSGCDWERLLDGTDVVFHLASQTSVPRAEADPAWDFQCNVRPIFEMLLTCREKGFQPAVIFSGTATQIGLSRSIPVNEEHYEDPLTIYDIHKLTAEKYVKHYAAIGSIRGCSLRLANVYGPGPSSSSTDRGILNLMVRRALRGEELTLFGTGRQVRDYVYIDDVVNAFLYAVAHIEETDSRHYVIGSGNGYSIAEAFQTVAREVAVKTGREVKVANVEIPSGISPVEDRDFVANIGAFTSDTGWMPRIMLADGISRTIDFFMSHEETI